MKPTDGMTDEQIREEREKCLAEMVIMTDQVTMWRKSHVNNAIERAPKEGYEGWDFLIEDLGLEVDTYIWPYASRFYQCGYMTKGEVWSWLAVVEDQKEVMRRELEELAEEGRKIKLRKSSLKHRLKRRLLRWLA